MEMKISTFEEYKIEYQKSITDPKKFWEKKLKILVGEKNGIAFWTGTLQNQK